MQTVQGLDQRNCELVPVLPGQSTTIQRGWRLRRRCGSPADLCHPCSETVFIATSMHASIQNRLSPTDRQVFAIVAIASIIAFGFLEVRKDNPRPPSPAMQQQRALAERFAEAIAQRPPKAPALRAPTEFISRKSPDSSRDFFDRARRVDFLRAHPDLDREVAAAITDGKIVFGMTADQVLASWGHPAKINITVTDAVSDEQWIYGHTYVYLSNGKVTSWQYPE